MMKYEGEGRRKLANVKLLDWQLVREGNIVYDISYFLFCHISIEDLDKVERLLDFYYNKFSSTLKKLGQNPELLYSKETFLSNWKINVKNCMLQVPCFYILSQKKNMRQLDDNEDILEHFKYIEITNSIVINRTAALANYLSDNHLI